MFEIIRQWRIRRLNTRSDYFMRLARQAREMGFNRLAAQYRVQSSLAYLAMVNLKYEGE